MIASGRHAANRYGLMALIASLLATVAPGQEPIAWKTGPALETQLKQQYTIQWQERPLRPVLARLARETAVATFLDRRIDPDQPLSIETSDIPLNQLLDRIATEVGASTCRVSAVKYIGPSGIAGKLPNIAAQRRSEATKSPSDLRARLLNQRPLTWPELAQPRDLVAALAKETGLTVKGPEAIPHDLWPAVDLPSLAWTDRLSLVLAGFNLTFEIDAAKKTLAFKPL